MNLLLEKNKVNDIKKDIENDLNKQNFINSIENQTQLKILTQILKLDSKER